MTNHPNRNRNRNRASALLGKRVVAGDGDDHDTGRVLRLIDAARVEVGWDSGVRTPAFATDLAVVDDR